MFGLGICSVGGVFDWWCSHFTFPKRIPIGTCETNQSISHPRSTECLCGCLRNQALSTMADYVKTHPDFIKGVIAWMVVSHVLPLPFTEEKTGSLPEFIPSMHTLRLHTHTQIQMERGGEAGGFQWWYLGLMWRNEPEVVPRLFEFSFTVQICASLCVCFFFGEGGMAQCGG